MPIRDVTRESVLLAVAECDKVGRQAFLEAYGFGSARDYVLVLDGEEYDSKAIVGAAHKYARPDLGPLRSADFSGGRDTVVPLLTSLGFVVENRSEGSDASKGPRVWLVRAGRDGQYEPLALSENVALIGWAALGPIGPELTRDDLKEMMRASYGEERSASLASQAGQVFRFIHEIEISDLVVLPLFSKRGNVAIGRVMGDFVHRDDAAFVGTDATNTREVEWLATLPYDRFDPDIREAFGQQGTVSEIDKPDIAERLLAVVAGADASAIHLVLKWSPKYRPDTIERHEEIAEVDGAVWWGRYGAEGSTGLSATWLAKLRDQLDQGSRSHVYLHASAGTWRTRLLDITTDEADVDGQLIPPYYAEKPAHHTLWVKIADFEKIDPADLIEKFVLAQSGKPVTVGGLGNQGPLIIRAKAARAEVDKPPGNGTEVEIDGELTPGAVRTRAEAHGLTLPEELYTQLVATIESGKHVILTGPPGTAKTTLAQALAEAARDVGRTAGYVLTTATADWTTFETIGGLRPTAKGELNFEEGHFLKAIRNKDWLVIDELNRSNFDRSFGQLFTVLSGQAVVLPYERPGSRGPLVLVPDGAESPLQEADILAIPQSWRVIGTMNVFDKTLLFEMSFALMRRFAFVEVPSPSIAVFEALIEREAAGHTGAADLTKQLLAVRDLKDLGPAVFMDLARFFRSRLALDPAAVPGQVLFEGFYGYLLPQFEGIDDPSGDALFKKMAQMVGPSLRERLRVTLNAVLGLELQPPAAAEDDEVEVEVVSEQPE